MADQPHCGTCHYVLEDCVCGPGFTPKQVGGDHYQTGDHEPFLVIDEWQKAWPEGTAFFLGNTLKYIARLGRKSQTVEKMREDLDKAAQYLAEARKRI